MGDFLELIIAFIIIALGMLGSGKKKKKPLPPPSTGSPTPHEPGDRSRREPVTARDIEQILREQFPGVLVEEEPEPEPAFEPEPEAPAPTVPEPAEPSAWEAGLQRRARSVETTEPAGRASHERFHALYLEPQVSPEPDRPTVPSVDKIREMVVWREILGPPRGLE